MVPPATRLPIRARQASKSEGQDQGSSAQDKDATGAAAGDGNEDNSAESRPGEVGSEEGSVEGNHSSSKDGEGTDGGTADNPDGAESSGNRGTEPGGDSKSGDGKRPRDRPQGDESDSGMSGDQSASQASEGNPAGSAEQNQPTENPAGAGQKPHRPQDGNRAASDPQSDSSQPSDGDPQGEGAGADNALVPEKVNQEYAKKATDLVLDYLKNQQDEPDSQLLDKLNWTEDDMKRFVDRWQRAREIGRSGDEAEKREYLEALESLGIGRGDDSRIRRSASRPDEQRGIRDSGSRNGPPPLYREAFEAFRQSLSQPK